MIVFIKHREATFSSYGPRLWNSLLENLSVAEAVEVLKRGSRPTFLTRLLIDFSCF